MFDLEASGVSFSEALVEKSLRPRSDMLIDVEVVDLVKSKGSCLFVW